MQAPVVQVTVREYVDTFFARYNSRAYGNTRAANAKAGAEALMGMLKLVLSKGGREELRIALHCFKDQLQAATCSAPTLRSQQVDELFALLSALVDAAERLHQFSPVKETISSAVLEEVRWRLFRILAGDGFAEDVELRRRALDLVFAAFMRETATEQASQQRQSKLATATTGAGAAGSKAGSTGRGRDKSLHRNKAPLTGPDISSWTGLWHSLSGMQGKRMMPLLQSVMLDLYFGKPIPGSPAASATAAALAAATAAAAAATPASANHSTNKSNSSCGTAAPAMQRSTAEGQQEVELAPQPDQQEEQLLPLHHSKGGNKGSKLELVTATVSAEDDDIGSDSGRAAHSSAGEDVAGVSTCSLRTSEEDAAATGAACRLEQRQGHLHAASKQHCDSHDSAGEPDEGHGEGVASHGGFRRFVGVLKSAAGGTAGGGGGSSAKQWIPTSWVQFHSNLKDKAAASGGTDSSCDGSNQQDNSCNSSEFYSSSGVAYPVTTDSAGAGAASADSFAGECAPDWPASSGGGCGAAVITSTDVLGASGCGCGPSMCASTDCTQ